MKIISEANNLFISKNSCSCDYWDDSDYCGCDYGCGCDQCGCDNDCSLDLNS